MKKVEHPEDCIRIRNALLELGYDLNLYEVERFWREHSKRNGSDWVRIPAKQYFDIMDLIKEIEPNLNILNEIPFLPRN